MERRRKLFNNRASPQANPALGSNNMGAFHGATSIPVFTSDKMSEWKLGNSKMPLGQAIIYCRKTNGNYIAAYCDAEKKEGFYEEIPEKGLEGIIKTATDRELDIIYLGEEKNESGIEMIHKQICEYHFSYHNQPKNIKSASSRLPVITDQ